MDSARGLYVSLGAVDFKGHFIQSSPMLFVPCSVDSVQLCAFAVEIIVSSNCVLRDDGDSVKLNGVSASKRDLSSTWLAANSVSAERHSKHKLNAIAKMDENVKS